MGTQTDRRKVGRQNRLRKGRYRGEKAGEEREKGNKKRGKKETKGVSGTKKKRREGEKGRQRGGEGRGERERGKERKKKQVGEERRKEGEKRDRGATDASPCPLVRPLPDDTAAPGVRGSCELRRERRPGRAMLRSSPRCHRLGTAPLPARPRHPGAEQPTGRHRARPPPLRARPRAGLRVLPRAAGPRPAPARRSSRPGPHGAAAALRGPAPPLPAPPGPGLSHAVLCLGSPGNCASWFFLTAFSNASPGGAGNVGTHVGLTPLRLVGTKGFLVVPSGSQLPRSAHPPGCGECSGWLPSATRGLGKAP